MKIKKLLIVPSDRMVESHTDNPIILKMAKYLKSAFRRGNLLYDGEMQFYGDIPLVLGKENVYVLGKIHKHYFLNTVPDECPYPSCRKTPMPTFVSTEQLESTIKVVDAIIVSSRASKRGTTAIQKAKANDIPVAVIDFEDHESNYGTTDIKKFLCRGFTYGREFDLYFKKDLPLGYKTDTILPLCPIPVRPESYEFRKAAQETDIFYSGRKRIERCQPEREEIIQIIQQNFNNTLIFEHDSRDSFISIKNYWTNLSKCKIGLSPSGRVWDSFRHCEVGLTEKTVLLAPKPYVETVEPHLKDGKNAILYDIKEIDGRYHLKNSNDIVEKIKYYLSNNAIREKMSMAYYNDVMSGHTVKARSQYIIKSLELIS